MMYKKYHKNMITYIVLERIMCLNPFMMMKMNTSMSYYHVHVKLDILYLCECAISLNDHITLVTLD